MDDPSDSQRDSVMPRIEQRAVPRHAFAATTELTDSAGAIQFSGKVTQLSRQGVYVKTPHVLPAGTLLHVRISCDQGTFVTQGKIIFVQEQIGIGVAFLNSLKDQLQILDSWLAGLPPDQSDRIRDARRPAKRSTKKLGELLRERGRISQGDLAQAVAEQQEKIILLGELLLQRQLVDKDQLVSALEEVTNMPYLDSGATPPDPEALRKIPLDLARKCLAFPIAQQGSKLVVVMAEPQNLALLHELTFTSGIKVSPRFGFRDEILHAIDKWYALSDPAEVRFSPFGPEIHQGEGDQAKPEFLASAMDHLKPSVASVSDQLLIRTEMVLGVAVACLITWAIAWIWITFR